MKEIKLPQYSAKEIEALVKKRTPMPEDFTLADILYYQNLRLLYREYREGIVDAKQGKKLKNDLETQYGLQRNSELCAQNHYARWRAYLGMSYEITHHGCPICKKIARIFDGFEDDIRNIKKLTERGEH